MSGINDKYKVVEYEGKNWNLYDELTTNSYDALYSETQIKLIEMIKKYNFKIFYFNCKSITNNKIFLKESCIDLNNNEINVIKNNQCEDFFYIYKNCFCEIFYSFPKIDEQQNYYYDFMLVVNNSFKIDDIYNHSFKLIKIISVKEITLIDLTFEYIQNIFDSAIVVTNNCCPIHNKNHYDLNKIDLNFDDFVKEKKKANLNYSLEEYNNVSSFVFQKNFVQDLYAENLFKLICIHIWSFDRNFYLEQNSFGLRLTYEDEYNLNSPFLTNFGEITGCVAIDLENDPDVKNIYYTYSELFDNFYSQGISLSSFSKDEVNGKKVDLDFLKIIDKVY